jgi:hypothetical protein
MLLFVLFLASGPLHLVTGSHCLVSGFSQQAEHAHVHHHDAGHHHDHGDHAPGHNHHSADEHDIEFTGKTGSLKLFVSEVTKALDLAPVDLILSSAICGRETAALANRPPGPPGPSRAPPVV